MLARLWRYKIKALVTGAGSFVARSLIYRLAALGFSVRAFDTTPVDDPIQDVEYLYGDVTRAGLLSEMARGTDFIFHLLHLSGKDARSRTTGVSANLAVTIKLLTLAESFSVSTFVYLSGAQVYGTPKEGLINETQRRRPVSATGKEHLTVENYLIQAAAERDITVAILRAAPVIGWGAPRDEYPSLYFSLKNALSGRPIFLMGRGRHMVQYLDVEDLASAMVRVIRVRGERCVILNVAADDIVTEKELSEIVFESFETTSTVIHLPDAAMTMRGLLRRVRVYPIGTDGNYLFHPQTIIDPYRAIETLALTPRKTADTLADTFSSWIEEEGLR